MAVSLVANLGDCKERAVQREIAAVEVVVADVPITIIKA